MEYKEKFQKAFRVFLLTKEMVENPDKFTNVEELKKKVEEIKEPQSSIAVPVVEPRIEPSRGYLGATKLAEFLEQLTGKSFPKIEDDERTEKFMNSFSNPEWLIKEIDRFIKFLNKEDVDGDIQFSLPHIEDGVYGVDNSDPVR